MEERLTSEKIDRHIAAIAAFRDAYVDYLNSGGVDRRRAVIRATPAAQSALTIVGADLLVRHPMGGPTYSGLVNLAFLHEQGGFEYSDPPIYVGLLDVLEQATAALEHGRESLETMPAAAPVFCRRGHLVGRGADAPSHCPECGAPTVTACASCEAPVPAREGEPDRPASFCPECGAAFPWVDRQGRIYQLENLLAAEDLDEADELAVREQLRALADPDLPEDEQRRRWERVKALAPGLAQSGRTVLEGLMSAALRHQLGL